MPRCTQAVKKSTQVFRLSLTVTIYFAMPSAPSQTRASNRWKYRSGLGSAKFIFSGLFPVQFVCLFHFEGSVPVKIKNTLNYRVQVRGSKNSKFKFGLGSRI